MRPIYLDHHATTPLDPRVLEEMLPWLRGSFGNAGSATHAFGWEAAEAVETARARLASLLGATPDEVVFTSGATESNNLAILGTVRAHGAERCHVVTAASEHHAVLDACLALRREGARVSVLDVDGDGRVDPEAVEEALEERTVLVSIMAANNEIGTLQPIGEIARRVRARGVRFHCDAAQAVGRIPVQLRELDVDLLSLSAHKLCGPKGVGALVVRRPLRGPRLQPLQHGGGQERGLRPGTLNVPGIVGLGAAAQACTEVLADEMERVRGLRDALERRLVAEIDGLRVNGHREQRLPGNLSVTFPGVEAEELMLAVPQLALSAGSACGSGRSETSHVLRAVGLSDEQARSTVRFGLGRTTTEEEIETAAGAVVEAVHRLRSTTTADVIPSAVPARSGPPSRRQ